MIFKRILIVFLMIASVLVPSACASKDPAEPISFSLYALQFDKPYQFRMYIDYVNHTKGRAIEQAELTLEGDFAETEAQDGKAVIRLFEEEGIEEGAHNHEHFQELKLRLSDTPYTAYLSKVYFTDGSVWENTEKKGARTATVWEGNSTKQSPLRLMEANFYRQYEGAKDIEFNLDYLNTSKTEAIKGIIFEIRGKNADGSPCLNSDGSEAIITYPVFPEYPVAAESSNGEYHYTINSYGTAGLENSALFEIRTLRVLCDSGVIYDTSDSTPVQSVMLGKKGYEFSADKKLKSVEKLIDSLEKEFAKYDMEAKDPLIHIREHDFVLLRYPDFDIRAELDENNEIRFDSASFACYYLQSEYLNSDTKQEVNDRIDNIFRCVFCTLIKDLPYETMLDAVNQYLEDDSDTITLGDQSLPVTMDGGLIYDENGNLVLNIIAGCGNGMDYNPAISLLWAKNTIY